jgi:hypothetical protein
MRGKNAARAAPMFARLACSSCSAAITSGRRSSSDEGRPARATAAPRRRRARAAPRPARGRADQQRERIGRRGARLLQLDAERLGLLQQDLRLREVEARDRAGRVTQPEDPQRFAARVDRRAGQHDPLVDLAQRQIRVRDAGDDAQRGRLAGRVARQIALQRGRLQAAHAAPEIDLPLGLGELHLVELADHGRRRQQAARRAKPRVGRTGADRRPLVRAATP